MSSSSAPTTVFDANKALATTTTTTATNTVVPSQQTPIRPLLPRTTISTTTNTSAAAATAAAAAAADAPANTHVNGSIGPQQVNVHSKNHSAMLSSSIRAAAAATESTTEPPVMTAGLANDDTRHKSMPSMKRLKLQLPVSITATTPITTDRGKRGTLLPQGAAAAAAATTTTTTTTMKGAVADKNRNNYSNLQTNWDEVDAQTIMGMLNGNKNDTTAVMDATLYRFTKGLPQAELRLMVQESQECQELLQHDIELLERALQQALEQQLTSSSLISTTTTTKQEQGGNGSLSSGGSATNATTENCAIGHRSTTTTTTTNVISTTNHVSDKDATMTKAVSTSASTAVSSNHTRAAISEMMQSPFTPLDRYWTASALLGRLRDPLTLPSIITATDESSITKAIQANSGDASDARALIELFAHPAYTYKHENTAQLLAVWKKISTHRTAMVFRKPVRPEEAPGYADRIHFPMDLSLIRKMIVSRQITSYATMHQYIGLISHNCVKYNGRETDYGRVARDFEATADTAIRQAVMQTVVAVAATAMTTATKTTAPPPPSSSSSSLVPTPVTGTIPTMNTNNNNNNHNNNNNSATTTSNISRETTTMTTAIVAAATTANGGTPLAETTMITNTNETISSGGVG